MDISEQGLALIREFEGCRTEAYRCPAGVWTIGYGHTAGVKAGARISQAQAEEYLKRDVRVCGTCIGTAVKDPLSQNRYDALCSFIYNVGCGAFLKSTLLKKIKADPSDPSIRDEFLRWNKSGGAVLAGLTRRRESEADLYFS